MKKGRKRSDAKLKVLGLNFLKTHFVKKPEEWQVVVYDFI